MPKIKYKLTSDPTYNDYLGTIQFVHGVCEIDSEDVNKMQEIERFRIIGWTIDPVDGAPVEEKKPKRTRGKGKSKKGKRGKGSRGKKTASKPKLKPFKEAIELVEDKNGNLVEEKVDDGVGRLPEIKDNDQNDLFGGDEIEQSKDQPKLDGEGRSGDTGKDDSIG